MTKSCMRLLAKALVEEKLESFEVAGLAIRQKPVAHCQVFESGVHLAELRFAFEAFGSQECLISVKPCIHAGCKAIRE